MNDKPTQEVYSLLSIDNLNMTEFFKEINAAIENNNLQTVYQLSKIITRYERNHFKP